jgi:hypothetical protein
MEAIPLAVFAAADCACNLVFHWITRFRVPTTITSDHGPQFSSEVNGALEKTALLPQRCMHAWAAAAIWAEEIPWVLLGLISQPEVDTGTFFAPLRLRARSQKKSAKARRKKSMKKSKSAERERKKCEFPPQ